MSELPDPPAANAPPDDEYDDQEEAARGRTRRRHARRVLFGAFLVVTLSVATYAVWPWLLPAFIWEGPMVQMAGEHEATLIWYMTRPVGDGLSVTGGNGPGTFPVETNGRRCRATLTGLEPGRSYPYRIALNRRTLASDRLRTNKAPGEPFTFIVFGDSGKGSREQYRLAHQMTVRNPDFILHTGDLVYSSGERQDYRERFFEPYGELLRSVDFWPSPGNHDVQESDDWPYLKVFELPENGPDGEVPERNYWFDYASARIAMVDSNLDEAALREHVAPWLSEVFSSTEARWKFVAFHHPPYTGGHYPPDERIQSTLVPVLEGAGVDVVFNGHDHMYERTLPIRGGRIVGPGEGVVYVVTGAGGARLYDALPPGQRPAYCAAVNDEIHSFTYVAVSDSELKLTQVALGGKVLDEWTLRKDTTAQ